MTGRQIKRIIFSYAISIGVWMAMGSILVWQIHLVQEASHMKPNIRTAVILPLTRFLCFALLTPPIFYFVRRAPIDRGHRVWRTLVYVLGVFVFIATYSFLRLLLFPPYDIGAEQFVPRSLAAYWGLIAGTFADQIWMYVSIAAAAHAYGMFQRARGQELEKKALEQALAASELEMLKMQLHPHFLFNTLHGISSFVDDSPNTAKSMIYRLSQLLRSALEHQSSDLVTLADELKFVDAYLELEQMRLGDRLTVTKKFAPETLRMMVPHLICQPLIENALKHGIACCRRGGWLRMESRDWNGFLELHIRNSIGANSKPRRGTGVGMANTRARLRHLFGDAALFEFTTTEHEAQAVVRLPISFQAESRAAVSAEAES